MAGERALRERDAAARAAGVPQVARRELPCDGRHAGRDRLAAERHLGLAAREEGAHVAHHAGLERGEEGGQLGGHLVLGRGDVAQEQHARARSRLALRGRMAQQLEHLARVDAMPEEPEAGCGERFACGELRPPRHRAHRHECRGGGASAADTA